MRFIGIIPARMASTRFPGKPLTQICGRPMLWHVCRAVATTTRIYPWYVATADTAIAEACESWGRTPYILTRSDCRNGTERVADAVRSLAQRDPDDIVVNIQGDEPAIRPADLDALCLAFNDPEVKVASLAAPIKNAAGLGDRNRVKVLTNEDGDAIAFSRTVTAPGLFKLYSQHIGVYAYRRDVLARLAGMSPVNDLEQLAWMLAGYRIRMVKVDEPTQAVDTPADVARVEAAMCPGT